MRARLWRLPLVLLACLCLPAAQARVVLPEAPVVGALPVGSAAYPVPGGAVFVSPSGRDAGPGSRSAPYLTVAHALRRAPAGGTVVLRAGYYHESVTVRRRVTLQAFPGEAVWFDGGRDVRGWRQEGQGWSAPWTARLSSHDASGRTVDEAAPLAGRPDVLFVDGEQQQQVDGPGDLAPGRFWVDAAGGRLHVAEDPRRRSVRASDLATAVTVQGAHGTVLRGFGVRRYATPLASRAALRVHADRVTVEHVVVQDSATGGLSVVGSDALVRRVTAQDNGQLGFHAHHADRLRLLHSHLRGNNRERFAADWHAGGAKVTSSRTVRTEGNLVEGNLGTGLWFDESCWDVAVVGSLVRDNDRHGVEVELSAHAVVAGNALERNGGSGVLVLDSAGVEVWNNHLEDNRIGVDVVEGDRRSADLSLRGHDRRRPRPDPLVSWEVADVRIRNNVIISEPLHSVAAVRVEDTRRRLAAVAAGVTSDANAFSRPTPTTPTWVTLWADYPRGLALSRTVPEHQEQTGQDLRSPWADTRPSPFAEQRAAGYPVRAPGGPLVGRGEPLPAEVVALTGTRLGHWPDIGLLADRPLPDPDAARGD